MSDADSTKSAARLGFLFCDSFAEFDGLTTIPRSLTVLDGGVAKSGFWRSYMFGRDSRLANLPNSATLSDLGLASSPFSDYDSTGLNATGDSMFLDGRAVDGRVSLATVSGINAVQRQAYRANDAIRSAAVLFASLADAAAELSKLARTADTGYARDLVRSGRLVKGNHALASEPMSDVAARRYADGFGFIANHGEAYVRYAVDRAARQYAVGSFSHFDPAVLSLVMDVPHLCEEHLEEAGLTVARAVDRVKRFASGDVRALSVFFVRETGLTGSGVLVIRSRFDFVAFAAAIYFASK
jgi:hypothetical protein